MLRPTAPPPRYTPLPAAPDEALAHAATNSGHATSRSASIPRSLSGPTAFPSCMTTARSPERTPQAHLTPEDTGTLPLPPLRRSTSLDSTNICQASPPPSGPSSVAPPPPQRPSTQPPPLPRQLSPPSPTAAPIDELVVAHAQQPASEYDVQLSQETHEQVAQEPRTSLGLPKPLIPRLNLPLLAAARGSPSSRLSQQRWGSVPQLRSGVAASDSDPAPSSDMLLLSPPHTTSPPAPPHRLFGHPLHFPTPFLTGSINSTLSPSEPWHTQELYTSSRSLLDGSPSVKARGPEHSAPCAAQPEQALTGGSQHAAAGLSVVCVAFQAAVDASAYRASAECNLDECMSPPADATDTSPATADASCASADENAYPPSDSSADASGMRQERTPRDAGAAPVEGDEAAPSVVSFTRTVTGSSNDSNAENTDEKCSSCPASFMHDQPDTPYHAGALSDSDVRLADRPSGMRTADDVFLECLDISRGLDRVSERLSEQAPSRDSQELPGSPSGTDPVMHASADRDAYNSLADDDSSTEASSVTGGADSPRPSLDKADIEEVVHAHESTDSPIFQETTSSQPAHPGHSAAAAPVEAALAASGDRTSPDALPAAPAACDEAGATGFVVQDEAVLGAPEAGSAVAEDSEPSGSQHSPVQPVDECSDNGIEGSDVESEPKATSYTTPHQQADSPPRPPPSVPPPPPPAAPTWDSSAAGGTRRSFEEMLRSFQKSSENLKRSTHSADSLRDFISFDSFIRATRPRPAHQAGVTVEFLSDSSSDCGSAYATSPTAAAALSTVYRGDEPLPDWLRDSSPLALEIIPDKAPTTAAHVPVAAQLSVVYRSEDENLGQGLKDTADVGVAPSADLGASPKVRDRALAAGKPGAFIDSDVPGGMDASVGLPADDVPVSTDGVCARSPPTKSADAAVAHPDPSGAGMPVSGGTLWGVEDPSSDIAAAAPAAVADESGYDADAEPELNTKSMCSEAMVSVVPPAGDDEAIAEQAAVAAEDARSISVAHPSLSGLSLRSASTHRTPRPVLPAMVSPSSSASGTAYGGSSSQRSLSRSARRNLTDSFPVTTSPEAAAREFWGPGAAESCRRSLRTRARRLSPHLTDTLAADLPSSGAAAPSHAPVDLSDPAPLSRTLTDVPPTPPRAAPKQHGSPSDPPPPTPLAKANCNAASSTWTPVATMYSTPLPVDTPQLPTPLPYRASPTSLRSSPQPPLPSTVAMTFGDASGFPEATPPNIPTSPTSPPPEASLDDPTILRPPPLSDSRSSSPASHTSHNTASTVELRPPIWLFGDPSPVVSPLTTFEVSPPESLGADNTAAAADSHTLSAELAAAETVAPSPLSAGAAAPRLQQPHMISKAAPVPASVSPASTRRADSPTPPPLAHCESSCFGVPTPQLTSSPDRVALPYSSVAPPDAAITAHLMHALHAPNTHFTPKDSLFLDHPKLSIDRPADSDSCELAPTPTHARRWHSAQADTEADARRGQGAGEAAPYGRGALHDSIKQLLRQRNALSSSLSPAKTPPSGASPLARRQPSPRKAWPARGSSDSMSTAVAPPKRNASSAYRAGGSAAAAQHSTPQHGVAARSSRDGWTRQQSSVASPRGSTHIEILRSAKACIYAGHTDAPADAHLAQPSSPPRKHTTGRPAQQYTEHIEFLAAAHGLRPAPKGREAAASDQEGPVAPGDQVPCQPLVLHRSWPTEIQRCRSDASVDPECLGPVTSYNPHVHGDTATNAELSLSRSHTHPAKEAAAQVHACAARRAQHLVSQPASAGLHGQPAQRQGAMCGPEPRAWKAPSRPAAPATRTPAARTARPNPARDRGAAGWHSLGNGTRSGGPLGRVSSLSAASQHSDSSATVRSEDKMPATPVRAGLVRATVEKFKHSMPACGNREARNGSPSTLARPQSGPAIGNRASVPARPRTGPQSAARSVDLTAPHASGAAAVTDAQHVARSRVAQTVSKFATRMHCAGTDGKSRTSAWR